MFIKLWNGMMNQLMISVLSQAGMAKANRQQVLAENLYEIPSCTICLQQLVDDFICLDCGHVFHEVCIRQHFEYKKTCPNCQKQTHPNQIRPLVFQLTLNSKANSQLHAILAALDGSERKQVEHLLLQIKTASENVEKMKASLGGCEKELAQEKKTSQGMREEVTKKRGEIDVLRRENANLTRNGQAMSDELNERNKRECYLQAEVTKYRKQEEDYERYKKNKRLMHEHATDLLKYREELEQNKTSPDQMARLFFDILLMKNLQMLKYKDDGKSNERRTADLEATVEQLKTTVEALKRDIKDANAKRVTERKKYDQLKAKYRTLAEKARQKGGLRENDIPEMEDSQQGFGVAVVPSITKLMLPLEEQLGQHTIRKPLFNSASTIGGLNPRKRDDKIKFTT